MVRYNVAPVGQLPLQEPVPLLQQAGDQDGDRDLLVQCAINVVVFHLTVHLDILSQLNTLKQVELCILFFETYPTLQVSIILI